MWSAVIGVGIGFAVYLVYFFIRQHIDKKKNNKKDTDQVDSSTE